MDIMSDEIYVTNHGVSIGTIPADIKYEIVGTDGYKTFFRVNRDLTQREMNFYDIRKTFFIKKIKEEM